MSAEATGRIAGAASSMTGVKDILDALIDPNSGEINDDLMFSLITNAPFTEGRALRSQLNDAISNKLRIETGAQQNAEEIENIASRFIPSFFDSDSLKIDKLTRLGEFFDTALELSDPVLYKQLKDKAANAGQ